MEEIKINSEKTNQLALNLMMVRLAQFYCNILLENLMIYTLQKPAEPEYKADLNSQIEATRKNVFTPGEGHTFRNFDKKLVISKIISRAYESNGWHSAYELGDLIVKDLKIILSPNFNIKTLLQFVRKYINHEYGTRPLGKVLEKYFFDFFFRSSNKTLNPCPELALHLEEYWNKYMKLSLLSHNGSVPVLCYVLNQINMLGRGNGDFDSSILGRYLSPSLTVEPKVTQQSVPIINTDQQTNLPVKVKVVNNNQTFEVVRPIKNKDESKSHLKDFKPSESPKASMPQLELSSRTTSTGLKKVKNIGSWYDDVKTFTSLALWLLGQHHRRDIDYSYTIKNILYLISSHDQSSRFVIELKKVCDYLPLSDLDTRETVLEIIELCKKQNLLESRNARTKIGSRELKTQSIHSSYNYTLDVDGMMEYPRTTEVNQGEAELARFHNLINDD